jgi:hypothetical protein
VDRWGLRMIAVSFTHCMIRGQFDDREGIARSASSSAAKPKRAGQALAIQQGECNYMTIEAVRNSCGLEFPITSLSLAAA